MALESPHITASVVAAVEYPALVQQYRVTGVPKTVVNDHVEILGVEPEASFIDQVVGALA